MGGEEEPGLVKIDDVMESGICDGDAVEGGSAPAEFIDDQEGVDSGMVEDGEGLLHLHVKRALVLEQTVRRSQTGEDPIHLPKAELRSEAVATHLCQYYVHTYCSQPARFPTHVTSC